MASLALSAKVYANVVYNIFLLTAPHKLLSIIKE